MTPSLYPVLPCVLKHFVPAVPHAFTVVLKSDYLSIRQSYQTLAACSLVCRLWCWTAQAALCRVVILARPSLANLGYNNFLDAIDGAVVNSSAFLYALRARPGLGAVVHSISFACFDDFGPLMAVPTLALCPNIAVITFTTRPGEPIASHLARLEVYPSIRVFKHRGKGSEVRALREIDRCFPHLEELQGVTLEATMDDDSWDPRPRFPVDRVHFTHLRGIHVYEPDSRGLCQLAAGCPALALRTFRARSLDSLATLAPFRSTLNTLDVFHFPHATDRDGFKQDPPHQSQEVSFRDFSELRVLRVRRCTAARFPWPLPPNLEALAVNASCVLRHPERTRIALSARPSLRRVTLFYEDTTYAEAGGAIEKLFEGLSVEYDLVWIGQDAYCNLNVHFL
ncbi:hypothetical protein AURDEDRAFT_165187 [Auricularia subglabra TFB-10046 SS5]|nr:hypothetical protein AURDEDRAFT_165187 [Auricularia subglabra TFB-10046 SS5]